MKKKTEPPKCGVKGCDNLPTFEVLLYDLYMNVPDAFMERDYTCPFLCDKHFVQNESEARNIVQLGEPSARLPRGVVEYPFTNRYQAQGFSIYRPLDAE